MHVPRSYAIRLAIALTVVLGCAALISAPSSPFTASDKAYYMSEKDVNFVRPGLIIKVVSAEIAADGTIRARVRLTDPRNLPLDRDGITTPGTVATSMIAAFIPRNGTQYTSYTTRVQTSPITRQSATQAAADTGGRWEKVADGEYLYTFGTRAPSNIDRQATHSIGAYGSRNLTEFDLGTYYDDDVYNFIPAGGAVTQVRDVIRTASCNKCHDQLAFHGGSRRTMELCNLCHTPQTIDPDTGNTVDMPVMTHKIHMGANLPSVRAGKPYVIIGNQQSVNDYSEVVFPPGANNCSSCHEPGAATQANNVFKGNREACGACHDNVNFATGQGHGNLPQVSDNQCTTCHQPEGELDFDLSIIGAHRTPRESKLLGGLKYELVSVTNTAPGQRPVVTFRLLDGRNAPLGFSKLQRLAIVMSGPTTDYTSFTTGYVAEVVTGLQDTANGTYTYTMQTAIPAGSRGTYAIGIEGRRDETVLQGTAKERTIRYGAESNKILYFSVDGSRVLPRRKVVEQAKCNACHDNLVLHGENRNTVEQCLQCHNPVETDAARRTAALMPAESVNFSNMIHRIHTGREGEGTYVIYGFGGTPIDFSHVGYPAFAPNGRVGDTRNCAMCHVNGSENLPLPATNADVRHPRGYINPAGPVTAACLGCHTSRSAASHALANTTRLGESCATCHGSTSEFSVARAHAR